MDTKSDGNGWHFPSPPALVDEAVDEAEENALLAASRSVKYDRFLDGDDDRSLLLLRPLLSSFFPATISDDEADDGNGEDEQDALPTGRLPLQLTTSSFPSISKSPSI